MVARLVARLGRREDAARRRSAAQLEGLVSEMATTVAASQPARAQRWARRRRAPVARRTSRTRSCPTHRPARTSCLVRRPPIASAKAAASDFRRDRSSSRSRPPRAVRGFLGAQRSRRTCRRRSRSGRRPRRTSSPSFGGSDPPDWVLLQRKRSRGVILGAAGACGTSAKGAATQRAGSRRPPFPRL